MQDLHWRYNFNTDQFDFVENNPNQHYEPLLKQVHRPTLVIDCNLVKGQDIEHYVKTVVDRASADNIRFEQIIFDGTQDPVTDYRDKSIILDNIAGEFRIPCFLVSASLISHSINISERLPILRGCLFLKNNRCLASSPIMREHTHSLVSIAIPRSIDWYSIP